MSDKSQHTITSKQLVWTLLSSMIGIGILILPRTVGETARQGAWLAVLLGGALPLLNLVLIYFLTRRFPDLTLAEYSQKILGKFLGGLISLTYAAYTLLFLTCILQLFSYLLSTIALPRTPLWVLNAAILLVVANYARQNFTVFGRLNEFLFYLLLPLLPLFLAAFQNMRIEFFLPLQAISFQGLWQGIQATIFSYLGYEVCLVILPFVKKKADTWKGLAMGLALTIATYFYIVVICLAYFGPWAIAQFIWPPINLLSAVDVPIVERLEFFFIFLWVGVVFRTLAIQMFAGAYTVASLLKLPSHAPIVWLMVPMILFLTTYLENITKTLTLASQVAFLGLGAAVGIPLFLLTISLILAKKEEKSRSA